MMAERVMVLIILITSVLFLILFVATNGYVIGHARRSKISYKNFMTKIKYFNVQVPTIIQGIFILALFVSGILVLFTGLTFNAEFRVYAIPFIMLFVFVGALYFVFNVLRGLDEDMTQYKKNYNKANEAFKHKEEAEQSIEKTKQYKSKVVSLINDFEKQISTVDDPSRFNLKDTISIIDQFNAEQTATINSYAEQVLLKFNTTLLQYFEHKIPMSLELPNLSLDFEVDYNSVRSEVYDKYHKIFNETLFELIESRKYNTSKIITEGLQILKDNDYSPSQDLVELILLSIDNIVGSSRELIEYLINKKIVELEDLISYAINKKVLWVFKNNLFETQDQLTTISERLIKENAYSQSVAFISNYFARLKSVLAFTEKLKEQNKTLNLFNNYKKVMNVDATFYNESKVIENKLMSLKVFFDGRKITDKLKKDLKSVSRLDQAYSNKAQIESLYQTVLDKFGDLKQFSIQSLLMYSGLEDDTFDIVKTSKLLSDYHNRLLMKDLVVLSILLYAIFLYHNEDEDLYIEVLDALSTTKEFKNTLKGIDLNVPFSGHDDLAKTIIKKTLFGKERDRLANIVVNVEKERLTLNKLATIR